MKIYKVIFRLDYPLNYSLLDKLGFILDFIKKNSESKSFSEVHHAIDLLKHQITSEGLIDNNLFKLNLSLNTFDGTVDFKEGLNFDDLHSCKVFGLVDSVLNKIEIPETTFNRIGFRLFVLESSDIITPDKILKWMTQKNNSFNNTLAKTFTINDIGLTLESINENKESIRVNIGPYRKSEATKFFFNEPEMEGLLIDLDIFQLKMNIPGFNFFSYVKRNEQTLKKVSTEIVEQFGENLKNAN